MAASRTVRASGPQCSIIIMGLAGHTGTRPKLGLRPTTLQKLAGPRIEPPESVPVAIATIPDATAAPEPPLEPHVVHAGFHGLRVIPWSLLTVVPFQANSGVVVLPTMTAPWARKRSTTIASSFHGPAGSIASDPLRVGQPRVSVTSLMATGTPSRSPRGSPFAQRLADARAARCARPASTSCQALSVGSSASMRASSAASTSGGVKRFAR